MALTGMGNGTGNAMIREYGSRPGERVSAAPDTGASTPLSIAEARDAHLVPRYFRGDTSHLAGPGRGIQSVPEYKPK